MKAGNLVLATVAVVVAVIGWMTYDMSRGDRVSSTSGADNAQYQMAVASGQPVLLEFYADWCGPCRSVRPVVDQVSAELQGRAHVIKLNVDQNLELSHKYGIRSIPAFVALKGGREIAREIGVISSEKMRQMVGY